MDTDGHSSIRLRKRWLDIYLIPLSSLAAQTHDCWVLPCVLFSIGRHHENPFVSESKEEGREGRGGGVAFPPFDPYFDYSFNSVSHLSTSTRQRVRSNYRLSFSIWIFLLFHSHFSSYDTTIDYCTDLLLYFGIIGMTGERVRDFRNLQTHDGLYKWS